MSSGSAVRAPGRHLGAVVLLAALALLLYLPRLGVEILRNPLEVKYALVARQMLQGSSPLLVPRLFGELYPDKPPLYFWATAALAGLAGGEVTEATARFPAALAALGALLLVYRLGTDLFGSRAGLLGACTLATSNLFFWYARQGHPDQFLTAFVVLAGTGLWRMLQAPGRLAARRWALLAYAAMGLGVLSKGLLGLLLPLLAASGYLVLTGPLRSVPSRLHLRVGLPVFFAVVLAWYAPAAAQNGWEYVYETLVHQHVLRYAQPWVHAERWHYYLGQFPVGFFPGILFLPGALVLGWRASRRPAEADAADPEPGDRPAAAAVPGPRPFLFPLAWFVGGFVFFNLSSAKREVYLLPLYPAAALMVGWLWDLTLSRQDRSRRWVGAGLGVLGGAAVALAAVLVVLPRERLAARLARSRADTFLPGEAWQLALVVALLLGGAALVWWSWRRGRPGRTFATLLVAQAAVLLASTTVRPAHYEARLPIRAFAAQVEAAVPPGRPVVSVLPQHSLLAAFYIHRPVRLAGPGEALVAARAEAAEPGYVLVDGDSEILGQPGVRPLLEARFGSTRVVLVRVDSCCR